MDRAVKEHKISDYQDGWLYAFEASLQKVPPGQAPLQPETIGAFAGTGVQQAFSEKWFSTDLNAGASQTAVTFSPDGKMLLSGSGDKTLRLWDAATGKPLRTPQGHTDWVYAVAFSPDGKTLLSGSGDNTLRLWDVPGIVTLQTLATNPTLVAKVSEALQFLWERSLEDITFVHQPRRPALFLIEGYHLADAAKYRELLNPPAEGETQLDQVLRWARKALEQRSGGKK